MKGKFFLTLERLDQNGLWLIKLWEPYAFYLKNIRFDGKKAAIGVQLYDELFKEESISDKNNKF